MPKQKRVNKTKKDIVSDMQLVQDAERRRSLIKDILFPYLIELEDSVAYSKLLLQSYAGLIEGVYETERKKITVGMLGDKIENKLRSIFSISRPEQKKEFDRYMELTKRLHDISIQDLAYGTELPRFIDGYLMAEYGKKTIKEVDIEKIMGK